MLSRPRSPDAYRKTRCSATTSSRALRAGGLCTDIDLVDDYPLNYLAFAARQHRWVRGDWQIARWLWRTVPDARGHAVRTRSPPSHGGRFSTISVAACSRLGSSSVPGSWTRACRLWVVWSGLGLLVLAFPAYMQVGRSLTNRVRGVPLREHVLAERDSLAASATQAFLSTVFLLHQGWIMLDAIGRTLVRLFVTRRRMLEWITADRAARVEATPGAVLRPMLPTVIAAVAIAVIVGVVAPAGLPLALPVVILWCLAPTIAYTTGRPQSHRRAALTVAERSAFRRVARKTWRFFDDLVTPTDHWLIPDNLQENRRELIAHRTSPTNIGLQLLSTLAAYDFGYLNVAALLTGSRQPSPRC